jgi:hypothetical protein
MFKTDKTRKLEQRTKNMFRRIDELATEGPVVGWRSVGDDWFVADRWGMNRQSFNHRDGYKNNLQFFDTFNEALRSAQRMDSDRPRDEESDYRQNLTVNSAIELYPYPNPVHLGDTSFKHVIRVIEMWDAERRAYKRGKIWAFQTTAGVVFFGGSIIWPIWQFLLGL